jgi:hypothetical protein
MLIDAGFDVLVKNTAGLTPKQVIEADAETLRKDTAMVPKRLADMSKEQKTLEKALEEAQLSVETEIQQGSVEDNQALIIMQGKVASLVAKIGKMEMDARLMVERNASLVSRRHEAGLMGASLAIQEALASLFGGYHTADVETLGEQFLCLLGMTVSYAPSLGLVLVGYWSAASVEWSSEVWLHPFGLLWLALCIVLYLLNALVLAKLSVTWQIRLQVRARQLAGEHSARPTEPRTVVQWSSTITQ